MVGKGLPSYSWGVLTSASYAGVIEHLRACQLDDGTIGDLLALAHELAATSVLGPDAALAQTLRDYTVLDRHQIISTPRIAVGGGVVNVDTGGRL